MRACFLVIDNDYPGNISARKLVLESAKLNVITAYSADEAVKTLKRFPNVDGIVMDAWVGNRPCRELIDQLREVQEKIPVITVSANGDDPCGGEEYHVSGFDPKELLETLEKLRPRER
jgi:CheY-like chemotaxis protein